MNYEGTDIGQAIRHWRLKELLLLKVPAFSCPVEGRIEKMTADGEYCKVVADGSGGLGYWCNVGELQVLGILKTPSEFYRDDDTNLKDMKAKLNSGDWMNHE